MNVIKQIGRISWLKKLLKKMFYRQWKQHIEREKKKLVDAYKNYGLEALEKFHQCMEENNIHYTMAFGSILGAIREHGFIKHDLDIDVYMWIEDYRPALKEILEKSGFKQLYAYSVDNDRYGKEDTFEYKGVHIDIFYVYPAIKELPYCCDFVKVPGELEDHASLALMPRRVEIPIKKERKLVPFENIHVYIPINAGEICEYRYGPNYMKPDPDWHWVSAKESITEWREKINVTTYLKFS